MDRSSFFRALPFLLPLSSSASWPPRRSSGSRKQVLLEDLVVSVESTLGQPAFFSCNSDSDSDNPLDPSLTKIDVCLEYPLELDEISSHATMAATTTPVRQNMHSVDHHHHHQQQQQQQQQNPRHSSSTAPAIPPFRLSPSRLAAGAASSPLSAATSSAPMMLLETTPDGSVLFPVTLYLRIDTTTLFVVECASIISVQTLPSEQVEEEEDDNRAGNGKKGHAETTHKHRPHKPACLLIHLHESCYFRIFDMPNNKEASSSSSPSSPTGSLSMMMVDPLDNRPSGFISSNSTAKNFRSSMLLQCGSQLEGCLRSLADHAWWSQVPAGARVAASLLSSPASTTDPGASGGSSSGGNGSHSTCAQAAGQRVLNENPRNGGGGGGGDNEFLLDISSSGSPAKRSLTVDSRSSASATRSSIGTSPTATTSGPILNASASRRWKRRKQALQECRATYETLNKLLELPVHAQYLPNKTTSTGTATTTTAKAHTNSTTPASFAMDATSVGSFLTAVADRTHQLYALPTEMDQIRAQAESAVSEQQDQMQHILEGFFPLPRSRPRSDVTERRGVFMLGDDDDREDFAESVRKMHAILEKHKEAVTMIQSVHSVPLRG